jgi:thioredoxin reductase (NADPH)
MAKPVLLAVDDDPEVLAAIERDLRQQYRGDYRVMRAASAREALTLAEELQRRATPIALFLVDQRMPSMSGSEFLAAVSKIHPAARRVLLTAYADTEVAIQGINDLGLDHYLMKPWDPPEQRLYPVLDDLLASWKATVRAPYEGIRVAGTRWSAHSYEVKEFLSRNQVPYQWVDIEQDAPTRALVESLGAGSSKLPVVLLPDGSHLLQPTSTELADKVGLKTHAAQPFYDVIVVGGGPAGLANALYAASEGLDVVLIERNAPGGQAGSSSRIENYLGFPAGVSGADLAQRAIVQAKRFGAELLTAQEVVGLRRHDPYRVVKLADGSEIPGYSVVITTGMATRRLEAPGVNELLGVGVFYGAAMTEAATYRERPVCVVGGANSAGQGALFFARYAEKVSILVRAENLYKGMSRYLVDRILDTPNIEVVPHVEVAEARGDAALESLLLRNVESGEESTLEAAAMFIFIGTTPYTAMLEGFVELDERGFVLTGSDLPRVQGKPSGWNLDRDPFLFETNVPGVFAAGDVRSGANRRVAAAVGEGSAAIYSVHRYLETV